MSTSTISNYYNTLGVSKNSSQDEIRKAYKKLALKHHPDRNNDSKIAKEKFQEIAAAYEILGDETKRSVYNHDFSKSDFVANRSKNYTQGNSNNKSSKTYTSANNHFAQDVSDNFNKRFTNNTTSYNKSDIVSQHIDPKITVNKSFKFEPTKKFVTVKDIDLEYISAKDLGINDYSDFEGITDKYDNEIKFMKMGVDYNEYNGSKIITSPLHSIYKGLSAYYIVNVPYSNSIQKNIHLKGGRATIEKLEKQGKVEVLLDEKNFKIYKEQICNDKS